MKLKFLVTLLCLAAACEVARADQVISSVQQKLKNEGFYYGEITGTKDADTTAAIRRYQIRNGLPITGEVDAKTQRSLGLASAPASTPRPRATATPGPTPPDWHEPPTSSTRNPAPPQPRVDEGTDEESAYTPYPRGPRTNTSGLFDGTPLQFASGDAQARTIAGAQLVLMRRGFYDRGIDGLYGPAMEFAVRAYQTRARLQPTGRLDLETLTSLNLLLPQQQRRGFGPPRRRPLPPRARVGPTGELIYIPN